MFASSFFSINKMPCREFRKCIAFSDCSCKKVDQKYKTESIHADWIGESWIILGRILSLERKKVSIIEIRVELQLLKSD